MDAAPLEPPSLRERAAESATLSLDPKKLNTLPKIPWDSAFSGFLDSFPFRSDFLVSFPLRSVFQTIALGFFVVV